LVEIASHTSIVPDMTSASTSKLQLAKEEGGHMGREHDRTLQVTRPGNRITYARPVALLLRGVVLQVGEHIAPTTDLEHCRCVCKRAGTNFVDGRHDTRSVVARLDDGQGVCTQRLN
jgi:hypothetical protein